MGTIESEVIVVSGLNDQGLFLFLYYSVTHPQIVLFYPFSFFQANLHFAAASATQIVMKNLSFKLLLLFYQCWVYYK